MAILNAVSSVHATLTALTVDKVTLSSTSGSRIRVTNRDTTNSIYYRFDGVDPTVGGAESFVVLPGDNDTFSPTTLPAEVRIIATLGLGYSVMVVP